MQNFPEIQEILRIKQGTLPKICETLTKIQQNLWDDLKMTAEEPKPWDRQKNESGASYSLFNEYLKLGPLRTIPQLEKKLKKLEESGELEKAPQQKNLYEKSTTWHWKKRAEAYDIHRIEEERKELEDYALNRRKERLNQSHVQSRILHRKFVEHLGNDEEKEELKIPPKVEHPDPKKRPGPLKPTQEAYIASELLKGKKIVEESERLDVGDVTERTEQQGKHHHVVEQDKTVSKVNNLFDEAEKANEDEPQGGGEE